MLGVSIGLVLADLQLSKYWSAIYDMPSYGWSLPVLSGRAGGGKIRDKTIRDKITIKQKIVQPKHVQNENAMPHATHTHSLVSIKFTSNGTAELGHAARLTQPTSGAKRSSATTAIVLLLLLASRLADRSDRLGHDRGHHLVRVRASV